MKLGEKMTRHTDYVYLDHAGATPVSERVRAAMRAVEGMYSNPNGIYRSAEEIKRQIEAGRKSVAQILNVHAHEVYFTGSATESVTTALAGYLKTLTHKTTVLTTNIEHPAVLETLRTFEKDNKIKLVLLPVEEDGILKPNTLREALRKNPDVSLVSIMYANNETGTIQPVKECGRIIDIYNDEKRASLLDDHRDVVFHIDASQAGNYLDMDMKKLRAHMCSFNAAKLYGPKGISVLYKKESVQIESIIHGGGQERGMRSGTQDVERIVGMAEALAEATELQGTEVARLLDLQSYFFEKLQEEILEAKVWGALNDSKELEKEKKTLDRLPNNINIGLPNMRSDEMVIRLDTAGFAVSHKSSCSSRDESESYVLRALGASSDESNENIRITMGRSTTKDQLDALLVAIKDIYYTYKI